MVDKMVALLVCLKVVAKVEKLAAVRAGTKAVKSAPQQEDL